MIARMISLTSRSVVSSFTARACETRGEIDLDLKQWRAIAEGKTGSLFGWCGRAPAHLAGDVDGADRFKRCGELLGVAFQLADDLKDMVDPDSGKNPFADILNPAFKSSGRVYAQSLGFFLSVPPRPSIA